MFLVLLAGIYKYFLSLKMEHLRITWLDENETKDTDHKTSYEYLIDLHKL